MHNMFNKNTKNLMTKQEKKRKKLFETYASNLSMVASRRFDITLDKPAYMCPLCKNIFFSDSLNQSVKNPLTIEHIPPGSIDGKEIVLTCKKCNNNDGTQFDSHLDKKLNHVDPFLKMTEHSKLSSAFEFDNSIKSNGCIFIDENKKVNLVFEKRRTSPENYNNLEQIIKNRKDSEIKITPDTYDPIKSNISILRSAFLIAFKKMGYGFLFSKNSDIPRRLIRDFQSRNTKFNAILKAEFPDDMLGVNIIVNPKNICGYLIVVKIKDEKYGVILPRANQQGKSIYEKVDNLIGSKSTLEYMPIGNLDFVKEEKYCLLPCYDWHRKKE